MDGRVKCRQSTAPPLRTTRVLVSAAKLMLIAASATQMPVEAGGGAYSWTLRRSPAGTKLRQPPFPEPLFGRDASRISLILGGSFTLGAIVSKLHFSEFKFPFLIISSLRPS